jgi:hypothetical protein
MSPPVSNWFVPRMWNNGECWIIGGGPSLPRQFGVPESIIQKVMNKELTMAAYSKYFKPLHDKNVIGTNVAYLLGDWVSIMYFCDHRFYLENIEQLHRFKNVKVTDVGSLPPSRAYEHRNIKKLKRDTNYGISDYTDTIRWNHNAGAGAINLAVHLGVKRIMLLGFDMKADKNGNTHWHSGLPNYARPTDKVSFDKFLGCFAHIAIDAEIRHVEILNVNPDSAIKEFKKVTLKEVL